MKGAFNKKHVRNNEINMCWIASSGGHIEELIQLKVLQEECNYFYMVPKTKWTEQLNGKKYFIMDLNRKNEMLKILSFILMVIQQFFIFIIERPNVILTTGAAVAIPIGLFGKMFGKKVIYIESICRVNSRSKTGNLMYKYADVFIVQWEEQLKCYPNAIYGGWIY